MTTLLTVLIAIVCVLLILIILVQNPKGGGLGSAFGGGAPNMLGGVKKTTDFLDRATWGLAIALLVLVLATNVGVSTAEPGQPVQQESDINTEIDNGQSLPVADPAFGQPLNEDTEE